ncbi:hypothetical protein ACOMHN_054823 [Nucella lapillus]
MGTVFIERSVGYKMGLLLVLVSVVCYLTGFSAPYWTVYRVSNETKGDGSKNLSSDLYNRGDVQGHNGLWETCSIVPEFSARLCAAISHHHGHPAWMSGVQGLQSAGLAGLVVSCLYAAGVNFLLHKPAHNRLLELVLLLSGMLGFTGSTIYAAESFGNDWILLGQNWRYHQDMDHGSLQPDPEVQKNDLGWAFGVSLTGSLLAIVSSLLIFTHNNRFVPRQSASRPVAGVSFTPAGGSLMFLPPEYLIGGCPPPPPYSPSPSPPYPPPPHPHPPPPPPPPPQSSDAGSGQESAVVVCEVVSGVSAEMSATVS